MAGIAVGVGDIQVYNGSTGNTSYVHKDFGEGKVQISDSNVGYVHLNKQEYTEWLEAQINLLKEWEEYDALGQPF